MRTGSVQQATCEPYSALAHEQAPARPTAVEKHSPWAALIGGLAELWQGVWSPGLNDSPTLSTLDVRDGGQHRR